jgi:uncharacterized protein (UPF0335 family)
MAKGRQESLAETALRAKRLGITAVERTADGTSITITSRLGHDAKGDGEVLGGNTAAQLRAFIERVERLEEEKKGLTGDIKDVYAEAKANGFDPVVMRKVVALRKQDLEERKAREETLTLYLHALGIEA